MKDWANDGFIWGLFWLRPKATVRELAEDLILIWETTETEEWKNQLIWIPL
jgi:hypothetical protein